MRFRSLATSMLLLGLVVTTVVALRAADEKSKVKDSDVPPPNTIKFSAAPKAVQNAFNIETKNAKIDLVGKEKNPVSKATFYSAIVPVGTNDYVIAYSEDGQLLEKILNPFRSEVKLEDCPPVVQKALKDDCKGAKVEVEVINKVSAGKRSDFIMDIVVQGKSYQIQFTEDGTLMSKVFNDEEPGDQPAAPANIKEPEKKETAKPAKKSK